MAQPDPRSQAAFDKAAKQALTMLTDDKAATMIASDAKARGPEVAVADALNMVVGQVQKSAQSAGIELPPEVIAAVQDAVARVLLSMMAEAGLVEDADAALEAVKAQMGGPDQQGGPPGGGADSAPAGVLAKGAM